MPFEYTPDEEIAIHRVGAIRQMCAPFSSHENGLPEWVKNSAAAYLRERRPPQERVIVILFTNKRGSAPATINCLDFVGMTSQTIEQDFKVWADPDAAIRQARPGIRIGELGGHGNGGKCYMTQMFEGHALLRTVRNGLGCTYGVSGREVSFGYVPDPKRGKDCPVEDVTADIERVMRSVRADLSSMPKVVAAVVRSATGFTFVQGGGPRDYNGRIPVASLVSSLLGHPQMVTPLQTCQVYVVVDGHVFNDGAPLSLPQIDPMEGFEEPRVIPIPDTLRDPGSDQQISTTRNSTLPIGQLRVFTSEKSMRLGRGGKRQWRHTVTYHTDASGTIGRKPMTSLDVDSTYKDYMYCRCHLEALDEFQTNERGELALSALTRAVDAWISSEVRRFCEELEVRERRRIRQEDRNELSRINDWLDRWKNQFMQDVMQGLFGQGEGRGKSEPTPLPSGTPASIQVSTSHARAGVGVCLKPSIKFFDSDGQRIRPVPYRWVSEDNNVAMVDEDLMLVQTFAFGHTTICAETLDGRLRSHAVPLEVVRVLGVRVAPHQLEMPAGTRRRLEALCRLPDDEEVSDVHLTWIEGNPSVARVSSSGLVYAFTPGETEVTAMDDCCRSDVPATITVTPSEGAGAGAGSRAGRGFPRILISEVDRAPNEDKPAVFRADDPPVYQRVQDFDNNVWWINLASPFARLYRGYGVKSDAWRIYHVERVIDIIVQIALMHGPDTDEDRDSTTWIQRSLEIEADIRAKAIESLAHFIRSGELDD
jgi:hypothetical protein